MKSSTRIVLIVIGVLVLLGVIGKVATSGYHCHNVHVGDTISCE